MRNIDFRKKQPSRWPWLMGLITLGLAGWGVTILLTPDPEPDPPTVNTPAVDTLPPAAIPQPPSRVDGSGAPDLREVAPLDEADLGETVVARGEVVATGNDAFWLLAGSAVIRVDSDRTARRGDTLRVQGTIRTADPTTTDVMASEVLSRRADSEQWTVVRAFKMVEETPPSDSTTAAGAGGSDPA